MMQRVTNNFLKKENEIIMKTLKFINLTIAKRLTAQPMPVWHRANDRQFNIDQSGVFRSTETM